MIHLSGSGAASGSMETLEKLQQFLEPVLFLSGLELANTFEHFYRSERWPDKTLKRQNRALIMSLTTPSLSLCQVLPRWPAAGAGERAVGERRGGPDWQLLPRPHPTANAKEFEWICRVAARVSSVPAATTRPPPAGSGTGKDLNVSIQAIWFLGFVRILSVLHT